MAQDNNKSSKESIWLPRIIAVATSLSSIIFAVFLGLAVDFVKDFYQFKLTITNEITETKTWIKVLDSKQHELTESIKDYASLSKEDHTKNYYANRQQSYFVKPDDKFKIIKE